MSRKTYRLAEIEKIIMETEEEILKATKIIYKRSPRAYQKFKESGINTMKANAYEKIYKILGLK